MFCGSIIIGGANNQRVSEQWAFAQRRCHTKIVRGSIILFYSQNHSEVQIQTSRKKFKFEFPPQKHISGHSLVLEEESFDLVQLVISHSPCWSHRMRAELSKHVTESSRSGACHPFLEKKHGVRLKRNVEGK